MEANEKTSIKREFNHGYYSYLVRRIKETEEQIEVSKNVLKISMAFGIKKLEDQYTTKFQDLLKERRILDQKLEAFEKEVDSSIKDSRVSIPELLSLGYNNQELNNIRAKEIYSKNYRKRNRRNH